jgi:periplasmic divalent cation tolerance protein
MADTLLCLTTCPDAKTAEHIAHTLVEERLAACVNRIPGVMSTYRWQGKLEDAAEVMLVIKTRRERFAALRTRLLELSPYTTPELVALDIADGSNAYLDWLAAETTPVDTGI